MTASPSPASAAPGAVSVSTARSAWLRRLAPWLLAAVLAYLGATLWVGGAQTLQALQRIGLGWIVAGLALTLVNFGLRAARWQLLLAGTGHPVPWRRSLPIYLGGIALSASPGKVGETVRSALLLRHGVPVGASLAAFYADRLADLHGVVTLAALASAAALGWADAATQRWALLLLAVLVAGLAVRELIRSGLWQRLAAAFSASARLAALGAWVALGGRSVLALWSWRVAPLAVAAGLLAYGLQGMIYAGMVSAVAPQVSVATALAIFAASTLAGAASMVPGGIGAMELSLVLLLGAQGVSAPDALAVALALRAVTFWFGLLLGAAGLAVVARQRQDDDGVHNRS